MGHRANLIIVRNQSYDLYYSHWCANTLPCDLFWGEQYAISFIEMQTKMDESGWLNDVWAEGGAIVDLDNKRLLLYGGEDLLYDIPLRNLYLKLMRNTWPGWEIEWAYEGILDLASYVGYPKDKVISDQEDEVQAIHLAPPIDRTWVDAVLSVQLTPDELLLLPLEGGIKYCLMYGQDLPKQAIKSFGYSALSLEDWTETFPVGGLHLDMEQKKAEFWYADTISDLNERIKSKWPDWEVMNHYHHYEFQLERCGGRLQFQQVNQLRLLEQIKALLLGEASNPLDAVERFIKKEAGAGKRVKVNPYALTSNRYELSRDVREEILESAIKLLS